MLYMYIAPQKLRSEGDPLLNLIFFFFLFSLHLTYLHGKFYDGNKAVHHASSPEHMTSWTV